MAYTRAERARARKAFVGRGWSYRRISEETGIGKTTLLRWARAEGWEELREQDEALELESRRLLLEILGAAREEADPQLVYAAVHAAQLAGMDLVPSRGPSARQIAVALVDVLAQHHALGPLVRRHRQEVVRLVLAEVDRLDRSGEASSAA